MILYKLTVDDYSTLWQSESFSCLCYIPGGSEKEYIVASVGFDELIHYVSTFTDYKHITDYVTNEPWDMVMLDLAAIINKREGRTDDIVKVKALEELDNVFNNLFKKVA